MDAAIVQETARELFARSRRAQGLPDDLSDDLMQRVALIILDGRKRPSHANGRKAFWG